jgi:hypothetical protein
MTLATCLKGAAAALTLALAAGPVLADDATPEQMAALGARIERLEDANAIEIVQRSYGYFVDKGLWTDVTDLFAENAHLEIGGRGVQIGKPHILDYMRGAFDHDGITEGQLINHTQYQPIVHVAADGKTARLRSRAFVMSTGGWGLPIYENQYVKENGVWKISVLHAPFTMYTNWTGWAKFATPNTRPDSFGAPPDLPPTVVYLTYPSPYVTPFHYPNPVTGKPWVEKP